jgi:hypothetical protein
MKARLTSAIAAAAVAIPIATAGAAPALATTTRYQLTLRVIDRSGHQVAPLDAQVLNVSTGVGVDLGSGTHRLLPPGRYNVAAWITTGTGPTRRQDLAAGCRSPGRRALRGVGAQLGFGRFHLAPGAGR